MIKINYIRITFGESILTLKYECWQGIIFNSEDQRSVSDGIPSVISCVAAKATN